VHDALQTPGIERVFIELRPRDARGRAAAESVGFKYYGAVPRRRRGTPPVTLEPDAISPQRNTGVLGRLWILLAALCALFGWLALG
jgi:hypothetical protein